MPDDIYRPNPPANVEPAARSDANDFPGYQARREAAEATQVSGNTGPPLTYAAIRALLDSASSAVCVPDRNTGVVLGNASGVPQIVQLPTDPSLPTAKTSNSLSAVPHSSCGSHSSPGVRSVRSTTGEVNPFWEFNRRMTAEDIRDTASSGLHSLGATSLGARAVMGRASTQPHPCSRGFRDLAIDRECSPAWSAGSRNFQQGTAQHLNGISCFQESFFT